MFLDCKFVYNPPEPVVLFLLSQGPHLAYTCSLNLISLLRCAYCWETGGTFLGTRKPRSRKIMKLQKETEQVLTAPKKTQNGAFGLPRWMSKNILPSKGTLCWTAAYGAWWSYGFLWSVGSASYTECSSFLVFMLFGAQSSQVKVSLALCLGSK